MPVTQKTSKAVLLLTPDRLLTDHLILESLHIEKEKGMINYHTEAISVGELRKHYAVMPPPAKDVLRWFCEDGMLFLKHEIRKKFNAQRAGISFESYYKNAMSRKLHELMEQLKPFGGLVKWYHKQKSDKGSYRTGPCVFSVFKPRLSFSVEQTAGELELVPQINLNESVFPLSDFKRFHFLLESNQEYFLLSYKDYLTLEWLADADLSQYAHDAQALSTQVLAKLEADDYTVNRNNHFASHEIAAPPQNRVMLSEISNSFLVLTPQWLYEGFLVEGPWQETYETTRNGEAYLVKRDKEAETSFVSLLESLHANFPKQLNGYYYLSFADAQKKQWFLKTYHRLLELDIQLTGMDMLNHFRYSPHQVVTENGTLEESGNLVHMELKVAFGKEVIPLPELKKVIQAGQRAVLLRDGSLGILSDDWMRQYSAIVRHGKVNGKKIEVPRWLAFTEQESTEDTAVLKPVLNKTWWEKWQQWQSGYEIVYNVPGHVQATLRPYQQKGFEWMQLLAEAGGGALLADDMGLGKTLQTICFLAYQLEQEPGKKHIIICPSSLIYNWQQELQKFAPSINTLVYHGATRNREDLTQDALQVIITSYGTARSDMEQLASISFGVVVLDESHNIKNPAALITIAVGQLQADCCIALSGTPVMNNTFDLYAQFNFLLPGMFGSREFFKREYADAIDRDHDEERIAALQKLTAPFILRRTKEQVAVDLPEKTETVLWCRMGAAQKAVYDEIKENTRNSLFLNIKNEGINKSKLAILQAMIKMRQVCNSPLLLPQEERDCSDSVKTDMLLDELENNLKGKKVLVFSQFTSMLRLLAKACDKKGITYYQFDGQTPPAKRAEMVNGFQDPQSTTNVFLISLKAGNAGLNLTAASYVFLFDPWWNTAVQQQAIDRAHRIGQTQHVFAYKMICKGTIEEKIIKLQERKKKLAENLISEDEGFVKSLTEEDIDYLFS